MKKNKTGKEKKRLVVVMLGLAIASLLTGWSTTCAFGNEKDFSLVGYWKFNEGEGNRVKDYSGNGNDGMIYNAEWIEIKGRKFLLLNRKSRIEVEDSPSLRPKEDISFECWIYLTGNLRSGENKWNWFFRGFSSTAAFQIYHNEGLVTFRVDTDKGGLWAGTRRIFLKNKWYHLVGTYEKGTGKCRVRIYVNGVLEDERRYESGQISSHPKGGVEFLNPGLNYPGIIYEARIYNRVLEPEEIEARYKEIKDKLPPLKEEIERLQVEEFEDFEKGTSQYWELQSDRWSKLPWWGKCEAEFTSSPEEVIDGEYSIKLKSETDQFKCIYSKEKLIGKRNYTLEFDYKILEKRGPKGGWFCFKVCFFPTPPYEDMSKYYLNVSPLASIDHELCYLMFSHPGPGREIYLKGEEGEIKHKKINFRVSQEAHKRIVFMVRQGAVSIDNIKLTALRPANMPPGPPEVIAPLDRSDITDFALDFFWYSAGSNAIKYELQVSPTEDFKKSKTVIIEDTGENTVFWMPEKPLQEGKWYWRVRGINEYGKRGKWSVVRSFRINKDHSSNPIEREISPEKPLFLFRLDRALQKNEVLLRIWKEIPESIKPYCAFGVVCYVKEMLEKARFAEKHCIPIYFQVFHKRLNPGSLSKLEYIFQHFDYVKGAIVVEQSVWAPYCKRRNQRLYRLAAKYGKMIIHTDFTHHFYTLFDEEWRKEASSYSEYIFPVEKGNYPSLFGYSTKLGWWFTHEGTSFGWGPEAWYWFEGGFGELGKRPGRAKRKIENMKYFPPTFWGIFCVLGACSGASLYVPEIFPLFDVCTFWNKDGTPTYSWKKVVLPLLEDMVKYKLIPEKEEVLKKVKVAFVVKEEEIGRSSVIGWVNPTGKMLLELMKGIYGFSGDDFDIIPDINRYYFVPVILEKDIDKVPPSIKPVFASEFNTAEEIRDYLNRFYPPVNRGKAFVAQVGSIVVITNTHPNKDIQEDYHIRLDNSLVKTIEGKVGPHHYLIVKELEGGIFVHVNNRAERKTTITISCTEEPKLKVEPSSALEEERWDEETKKLTVNLNHSLGAVRVKIGEKWK